MQANMPYMEHMGYYVLMFPLIHITIIWINKGTQNHILDVVDQNTMLNFISWAKSIKLFHYFFKNHHINKQNDGTHLQPVAFVQWDQPVLCHLVICYSLRLNMAIQLVDLPIIHGDVPQLSQLTRGYCSWFFLADQSNNFLCNTQICLKTPSNSQMIHCTYKVVPQFGIAKLVYNCQ